ncbi:Ig-like domain-containing protein [Comamonas sp. JC664]|uniref:Ig-like domain-containing protein n=1 Tax=Comamonas sp. JC664 TaxID=2801917 RepID=UPI00191D6979|nr:Ig-like domain-containing protein [Comamonas sp. JC664]MBL0698652.1 Ig-like domain-containing protein [Comamonas sp. JC664]GHG78355.1 hypothetical protein GCM10012319_28780 [Comamonas sp. KCTC 72670]
MNLPERFLPPPWTAAVVLLCASACINVPAIESAETEVRMISPAETAYTNGALELRLAVTGHAPDRVELLKNGEVLAELAPPYVYTWDTTGEAEGTYRLEARAVLGDTAFVSPSRDVVVDRTPPQVVSRVPEPGAQEVWVQSPIRAEFSEPLKRSTVTTESVHLRVGELAVAHTVSLSEDGRTVTVTPVTALTAPSTVELRVEGTLTDLAGNAAVDLGASWGWVVPEFVPYPAPTPGPTGRSIVTQPYIKLDANGHPTVLTHRYEYEGTYYTVDLFVHRWTGSRWEQVGPGLKTSPNEFTINSPNIQLLPDGTPVVAWQEDMGGQSDNYIHVAKWDGTSWVRYGGERGILPDRTYAHNVALQLNSQGHPVVAFSLDMEDIEGHALHVYQWTGTQWARIGHAFPGGLNSWIRPPVLALDGNDNAFVAAMLSVSPVRIHAWHWSGTDWEQSGDLALTNNPIPDLSINLKTTLTENNQPIIAWTESNPSTSKSETYISQKDQAQWTPLAPLPSAPTNNSSEIHAIKSNKPNDLIALSVDFNTERTSINIDRHSHGKWDKLWSKHLPRRTHQYRLSNLEMDTNHTGDIVVAWTQFETGAPQEIVVYRRNK